MKYLKKNDRVVYDYFGYLTNGLVTASIASMCLFFSSAYAGNHDFSDYHVYESQVSKHDKHYKKLKHKKDRLKYRIDALKVRLASKKIVKTPESSCGLTIEQASKKYLTKYADLKKKLKKIKKYSRVPIQVGPLIKNGYNKGLIAIDKPLDLALTPDVNVAVCEDNDTPSIREAVICSVKFDVDGYPERGNTNPSKVGKTTKGREIWAARLGKGSTRVMIVSQQHGNEYGNSEGALNLLVELTTSKSKEVKKILKTMDILIVPRVNVDGGEPGAEDFPEMGVQYTGNKAFIRSNLNPEAGGGFTEASEPDFFGIVGRGYNLNRYNYADLKKAIRPVENQAIVAAVHAFRPKFGNDFHATLTLANCDVDLSTLDPDGVLPGFPSILCAAPAPPIVTAYDSEYATWFTVGADSDLYARPELVLEHRNNIRTIGGKVLDKVDQQVEAGTSRYAQFSAGGGAVNNGVFDGGVAPVGTFGTFTEIKGLEFGRFDVVEVTQDPQSGDLIPVASVNAGRIDPCFVKTSVGIATKAQKAYLESLVEVIKQPPVDEGEWCDFSVNNTFHIPFEDRGPAGDQPHLYIGQPGGFPAAIFGVCPQDMPS